MFIFTAILDNTRDPLIEFLHRSVGLEKLRVGSDTGSSTQRSNCDVHASISLIKQVLSTVFDTVEAAV